MHTHTHTPPHSLKRMTVPEYLLLLATFGAVVAKGLQGGILIGMLLATCYFAVEYAKVGDGGHGG